PPSRGRPGGARSRENGAAPPPPPSGRQRRADSSVAAAATPEAALQRSRVRERRRPQLSSRPSLAEPKPRGNLFVARRTATRRVRLDPPTMRTGSPQTIQRAQRSQLEPIVGYE